MNIIVDEILPCQVGIQVTGAACAAVVGETNIGFIDNIFVTSEEVKSDVEAFNLIDQMFDDLGLPASDGERTVSFNPDFFPTLEKIVSPEEDIIQAQYRENDMMLRRSLDFTQIPIFVTSRFDPMGDMVQSRTEITSSKSKIVAKVFVTQNAYFGFLARKQVARIQPATDQATQIQ